MVSISPSTPSTVFPPTPSPSTLAAKLPVKPLLRRSTLSGTIRKRDEYEVDIDIDPISPPTSPGKRLRVTFNPEVLVKTMDDQNEKSIELVREEVRNALDSKISGQDAAYVRLRSILKTRPTSADAPSNATLRNYVIALTTNVAKLNSSCRGLIEDVLACDWLGRRDDFINSYIRFLGNLVSVQGGYIGAVITMLVGKFGYCKSLLPL